MDETGKKESDIKEMQIYIKPEENAATMWSTMNTKKAEIKWIYKNLFSTGFM